MAEAPASSAGLPPTRRRWGRFSGEAMDGPYGGRQQDEDSLAVRRGAVREAILALGDELANTEIPTEALVDTIWSTRALEWLKQEAQSRLQPPHPPPPQLRWQQQAQSPGGCPRCSRRIVTPGHHFCCRGCRRASPGDLVLHTAGCDRRQQAQQA